MNGTFGIKERKKKVHFYTTIDIVDDNNDVCVSAYDRRDLKKALCDDNEK